MNNIYARISNRLPGRLSAALDWHLLVKSGRLINPPPFNGQDGRIEIVKQILQLLEPKGIIESGTFRGSTTIFLQHISGLQVYTVEAEPRYFHYAKRRFKQEHRIQNELG